MDSDNFLDETDTEFVDREFLKTELAESVPEVNTEYALRRFVEDGDIALQDFVEALTAADDVWSEYLEADEHNPRELTERQLNAYGAGALGPTAFGNCPNYSGEVISSKKQYRDFVEDTVESNSERSSELAYSLLAPEGKAQAELYLEEEIQAEN